VSEEIIAFQSGNDPLDFVVRLDDFSIEDLARS
jgi:hypothetical protein